MSPVQGGLKKPAKVAQAIQRQGEVGDDFVLLGGSEVPRRVVIGRGICRVAWIKSSDAVDHGANFGVGIGQCDRARPPKAVLIGELGGILGLRQQGGVSGVQPGIELARCNKGLKSS